MVYYFPVRLFLFLKYVCWFAVFVGSLSAVPLCLIWVFILGPVLFFFLHSVSPDDLLFASRVGYFLCGFAVWCFVDKFSFFVALVSGF